MENKKSFVMYDSYIQSAEYLTDAEFREFILKIRDFALYGIDEQSTNNTINMLMCMVKPTIDASLIRYQKCVENGMKGKEYGKLGGRPRKDKTKSETPIKPQEGDNVKPQEKNNIKTPIKPLNVNDNVNEDVDDNVELNDNIKPEKETKEKEVEVELSTSTSNTEKENQEIEKLKNSIVLEDSDDDDLTFNEETKSTKNSTSTSFNSSSLSSYPKTGKDSNLYCQELKKKVNPNDKDTMNLSDYVYEEIAKGVETIAIEYRIPNKKFDTRCKDIFFTCLRQLQDLTGVDEDRGKEILVKSINNIVAKNSNKLANVSTGLI